MNLMPPRRAAFVLLYSYLRVRKGRFFEVILSVYAPLRSANHSAARSVCEPFALNACKPVE